MTHEYIDTPESNLVCYKDVKMCLYRLTIIIDSLY